MYVYVNEGPGRDAFPRREMYGFASVYVCMHDRERLEKAFDERMKAYISYTCIHVHTYIHTYTVCMYCG